MRCSSRRARARSRAPGRRGIMASMIRLAALADIHGNVWALEAVLKDAKGQGADGFVNAGDLLSGPLDPAATADLLMSLDLPTVAGNHERQLLACEHAAGGPSDQYAFEHVSLRHRDWLRQLPSTLEVDGAILLCHGTPSDDRAYLLEEVERGRVVRAPAAVVEARAAGAGQRLIVCGHSHQPGIHWLSDGRLVVNPGSVGLQAYDDDHPSFHVVENGSPHARYAICERTRSGWSVALRSVEYDHAAAVAAARRNGREDWARWLQTGRA
ncbi:metallophosphoesterase [Anaeromyxobacter sp. Fw109-5]|nr:metallophosphoesterase [Anaeromyxobacter sp. Fw109-5]